MIRSILSRIPVWKLPILGKYFDRSPKVAVVRLEGPIGGPSGQMNRFAITLQNYEELIERAFNMNGTVAVAFVISSPGGWPVQCQLISHLIRRKADEKKKPVIAFIEDMAASGGYWIACAADEIYADAISVVGSIGIISASFGVHQAMERYGVERRVFATGPRKAMLDMFLPLSDDDIERMKVMQNDLFQAFVAWVKERRGERLTGPESELFSGDIWVGTKARELGLIDGIGHVKPILKEKFGEYVKPTFLFKRQSFMDSLQFGARGRGAEGPAVALVEAALAALERRLAWARFGL